jgi:hypothetical protein
MNWKTIALLAVLVDFTALSFYALAELGVMGFIESAGAGGIASITIFADLVIALSLVSLWMFQDARERGVSFAPYFVATLLLGSVGPLLYLVRRGQAEASDPRRAVEVGA